MATIQVQVRLLQAYPGAEWPDGKQGETSDWLTVPELKRMLHETGAGFQLIEWEGVDLGIYGEGNIPALEQIVDRRRV